MASRILRFIIFPPYAASLSVDFKSISCLLRAMCFAISDPSLSKFLESLIFLDSQSDFSSCFTNLLLLTVAAFDAINSRAI
ncbi:unnamed protein product [Protopolystoma xenopodis]|uniref:Uncharacterized protein n=1 Tax=Protopolystoma xenopodis TaxID=117903 RepID=A0A448XDM4_9PLAT|nr:unnamed protein product [Protopolystoma xenopodis]